MKYLKTSVCFTVKILKNLPNCHTRPIPFFIVPANNYTHVQCHCQLSWLVCFSRVNFVANFVLGVKTQLREWVPQRAPIGRYGPELDNELSFRSSISRLVWPIVDASWTHTFSLLLFLPPPIPHWLKISAHLKMLSWNAWNPANTQFKGYTCKC